MAVGLEDVTTLQHEFHEKSDLSIKI